MGQKQPEPASEPTSSGHNFLQSTTEQHHSLAKRLFATERILLAKIMRAFGDPPVHIVLWNGLEIPTRNACAVAKVIIRDWGALWKLFVNHELYFGELYSARRIEVQGNLVDFLEAVFRVWQLPAHDTPVKRLLASFDDLRRNTIAGARRNIQHHYDIGNDFYKLWLDERMVYTCAYFPSPSTSLEEAQLAKMDHVCRKLDLRPGETVIEAGCGWGTLALHMARHYGVTVHAYNISREQLSFARERARAEGLDGKVSFIEDDYRNVCGKFDAFVSVGMLEHVGVDHYRDLGEVIDRGLKESGRGLIHTIGLNYPRPMDAWAQRHIFPGAAPPSLGQMMQILEPYDFSVLDVENLRLHYAKTLDHWLHRYEQNTGRIGQMFDAEFVLAWRLYLAGSLASFSTGNLQLFQLTFARACNNRIPWTRQYLYRTDSQTNGQADGSL